MGLTSSTSQLTVRGLRDALEAFAPRAVLEAATPGPPAAEVALVTAELDGNPPARRLGSPLSPDHRLGIDDAVLRPRRGRFRHHG